MAVVNPGNFLPFYDNILDQVRYRTGDHNFAFVADWEYLIPWQVVVNDLPSTWKIHLVGREIGQTNYDISGQTAFSCTDTQMLFTFTGAIRPELECGYYYVHIQIGSGQSAVNYFSEMLYIEQRNDFETPGTAGILYNGTADEFTFNFADTRTTDYVSRLNEYYTGGAWVSVPDLTSITISAASSVTPLPDGTEERFVRRTIELLSGAILQTVFRVHWNPVDKVGTVSIAPFSTNNKNFRKDRFMLTAGHTTDLSNGDLLLVYTEIVPYVQRADLLGYIDFPRGETTLGTLTDGNGNNTNTSMVAKERRAVRFAKIPDDSLFFFQLLPFHSAVTLLDTVSGRSYTLAETEVRVEPEAGGDFSTVELSWRHLSTSVSKCDENLGFTDCVLE